jgi:hypothetical protein
MCFHHVGWIIQSGFHMHVQTWRRAIAAHLPCALVLLTCGQLALAQHVPSRSTFVFENDMLGIPASDQNYTMGLSYGQSRQGLPDSGLPLALSQALRWVDRVSTLHPLDNSTRGLSSAWMLASSNFTPDDIKVSAPIQGDRPYASLLYMSSSHLTSMDRGEGAQTPPDLVRTQLQVGVLGTGIGREVQTGIHKVCCPDRLPQGWDNQIGQGGALTFLYGYDWFRTLASYSGKHMASQGLVSAGAELGYYTRVKASAAWMIGADPETVQKLPLGPHAGRPADQLVSNAGAAPQVMPATPGLAVLGPVIDTKLLGLAPEQTPAPLSPPRRSRPWGLWAEYEISGIAYNQMLQGAWAGRNAVKYKLGDMEPFVHRVTVGVELTSVLRCIQSAFDVRGDSNLYLTKSWRTRDLKRSPTAVHAWGGLVFTSSID